MKVNKEEIEALKKVIQEKESQSDTDILVPIGGGNPYWQCQYCDKTNVQISIDRENGCLGHHKSCSWANSQKDLIPLVSLLNKLQGN